MAIITISRQFGAGGATLGKGIADRLKYRFVSSAILDEIAKEANVSVKWVKSVDRDAGDWLMRFTSKWVTIDMARHVGQDKADFDEKKYRHFLKTIIPKIAEKDNAVIIGRASQFILQGHPNVLHILFVADMKDRISFLTEHWKVSRAEAEKTIQVRRKWRRAFLKNFDPREPNDPGIYHATINTSKISLEKARDMVVWMAKNLGTNPPDRPH
ncbi:MAG: cytidylate kinase-like family protein [Deltaproteobacteria bacterium]|nr:cytidylate kinase-like family protein [Deltaproteobacteria bacterium]